MESALFRYAKHYHSLGACVLPLDRNGSLCVQAWQQWQQETQTLSELSKLPWEDAAGLALVSGAHGWHCLRVDQAMKEDRTALLNALGLPDGYPWLIQTGESVSLWFRCQEPIHADEKSSPWENSYVAVPPTTRDSQAPVEFQHEPPEDPPRFLSKSEVEDGAGSLISDNGARAGAEEEPGTESAALGEAEPSFAEAAASMSEQKVDQTEDTDSEEETPDDKGQESPRAHSKKPSQTSSPETDDQRPDSGDQSGGFPDLKWDSDIEPTNIDWLWDGYIAHGMLHMLNGDPGTGKSTLLLTLAAQFSKKRAPDGGTLDKAVNTLYLSAEDQADVTLVPRYRAAAGEKGHLLPIGAANAVDISFPEQTAELQSIIEANNIQFCVIDPLFAFLSSGFQKNSEQDIREVLSGITEVADETGCAFVLVRHFNKKEDLSAVYRGGGSIGITAQARLGFALAPHPKRPEQARVLAWTKNNLSDRSLRTALVFRNQRRSIPKVGEQPTLEYEGEETWTADDLLSASKGSRGRPSTKRDNAEAFLLDTLSDKSVLFNALRDTVEEEKNYSMSTLRRADEEIPVEKEKDSMGRSWWTLPGAEDESRSLGTE